MNGRDDSDSETTRQENISMQNNKPCHSKCLLQGSITISHIVEGIIILMRYWEVGIIGCCCCIYYDNDDDVGGEE